MLDKKDNKVVFGGRFYLRVLELVFEFCFVIVLRNFEEVEVFLGRVN